MPEPEGSGRIYGFPPIAAPDARILILGSMPGMASLRAGEYYAHPRNVFWPIVAGMLNFNPRAPYPERRDILLRTGIALWDVLASCQRPGSADAEINPRTLLVNDFADFFTRHPRIHHVFFNGTQAEACFRRRVFPALDPLPPLVCRRLPSTSPAHATLSLAEKQAAWQILLPALLHSEPA